MAAIVQLGQAVDVGFNGVTYTDFVMEDAGESTIGDIEEIRDADNDQATKLISAKGHRYRLTGVVKADGTELATLQALVVGSTLTVNAVAMMVESVEINYSRLATRATITVVDDAITYS